MKISLKWILAAPESRIKPLELSLADLRRYEQELKEKVDEEKKSFRYEQFLNIMTKFHRYSFGNVLLIFA
jgi:hypothetical protein